MVDIIIFSYHGVYNTIIKDHYEPLLTIINYH